VLLFPGEGARDVAREPPTGAVTLIVVDGTWTQARQMMRAQSRARALAALYVHSPCTERIPHPMSPRQATWSTIEALMVVLGVLEGEPERFRTDA